MNKHLTRSSRTRMQVCVVQLKKIVKIHSGTYKLEAGNATLPCSVCVTVCCTGIQLVNTQCKADCGVIAKVLVKIVGCGVLC